jgi:hypothetical protein
MPDPPDPPVNEVDIISYIFPSVITVLVGLRFVLRRLKHERCYADDWIMCSMLGLITFTVVASRKGVKFPYYLDSESITDPD